MKHQVLFCLSVISSLSYSMEQGDAIKVADLYYKAALFNHQINREPVNLPKLQSQYAILANLTISRQEEQESLKIIEKAVREKSSLKDLIAWSELREQPRKIRQIR